MIYLKQIISVEYAKCEREKFIIEHLLFLKLCLSHVLPCFCFLKEMLSPSLFLCSQ